VSSQLSLSTNCVVNK